MMGRLKGDQSQLFYEFHLDGAVPADHLQYDLPSSIDDTDCAALRIIAGNGQDEKYQPT